MALKHSVSQTSGKALVLSAFLFAIASFLLSAWLIITKHNQPALSIPEHHVESALERIKRTGVVRVGYGGFPPYTIIDPSEPDPNKRVSGFVADMVYEMASRFEPPIKVEWFNLNWATYRADMLSKRFDFLADATYKIIPKAIDFNISRTFSYFGIGAAIVRKDEKRFKTFNDLDRSDITIALAQGYITTDYARKQLSKPTMKAFPVGVDAFSPMNEVLSGRADVALNDVPTVLQFARAHPDRVKALWIESPPSTVAAGLATRREDTDLLEFLNTTIEIFQVDGTLAGLDQKWKSLGHFQKIELVPGAGLKDFKK